MTVKAVIFDLWGTIVENGTYSPLKQSFNIMRVRMPFGRFVQQFEDALMRKQFEDQAAGFKEVFESFGLDPKPFIIDKLIGVWNKNKLLATLYPETVDVLESLKKKGVKLALLSNTPSGSGDFVLDKFELRKYFDVVALSCETGMLKQDPKSFDAILDQLGVSKEETLMVGDSIETDIKGAENVGIKAVLVDRRDSREFENKVTDLADIEKFF